MGVELA